MFMNVDQQPTQIPTSLGSWAILLANAIESYGLDSEQLFRDAGVELADIKKPDARFPTSLMAKIWHMAAERSSDPYIGLRVAEGFKPSVFSALGMAMAASRHVYDALLRCSRYSSIVSDAHTTTLEENETEVAYVVRARPQLRTLTHIYGMSASICCIYRVLKELAGESLNIKEVHFEGRLESTQPFEEFFGCAVFYGSDCNKIVFEKDGIYSQQQFANSKLATSLDDWIEEYLAKNQEDLVATRVQKYLLKHLIYGELDQTKVASGLAMSTRILQRRLKSEGAAYSELFDECRKKLAIKLIDENKLPLSEVAIMLGFSDQSNFTRAFKRWTRQTPHQYKA